MPQLKINGIDLYYELHGTVPGDLNGAHGLPLMLIAGFASDSQSWLPVLEPLARHYPLVLLDNRGCGRTLPLACANQIGLMTDDCIALADHLGIGSFHLLGHSMGGFVAIDCALRFPDRVARLALANTSPRNSARNQALFLDWIAYLEQGMSLRHWWRNFFYWVFTPAFFEDTNAAESLLQLAVEYPYAPGLDGLRNQVHAMAGFDRTADLHRIGAETLVLCSDEDLLFPPGQNGAGLAAIPRAKVSMLNGAAHASLVEMPDAFAELVLEFLGAEVPR